MDNRDQELALGLAVLGRPYKLGAKWALTDPEPQGPVDCSGFTRWYLFRCRGIMLPDGSYNQIRECTRLPESLQKNPPPMSLGFFGHEEVDHAVIVYDDTRVIEARGEPYDAVILRPIQKWLEQPGFKGFYKAREPEPGR